MLLQMLSETADRHPERPAILFGDAELSYRELLGRTERVARGLASLGVAPGDRVALVHPNSPEFVVSFFAVTALGAIIVPINPLYQREELRYYFDHCDIRAVITDPQRAPACQSALAGRTAAAIVISTGGAPAGTVDFRSLEDGQRPGPLPSPSDATDAVYQYSSGSTGRPKRVARTHEQCRWEAVNFVETTGLGPDDRIFCAIPLFHTHGQGNCLLAAVCSGAALVMLEDANPFIVKRHRALEVLAQQRATVFPGVPFVFRLLADVPDDADLSALRLCFSAGTALPLSTFESFRRKFGVPVRQLYGCTEAGSLTINLDQDPEPSALSVGTPMRRVHVQVVDESRRPVAAGEVGEIAISTPAMTVGYYQMDDHNREVFRDGFFFTGDLGRLDADGRLWITGRKKLFIEVAGNKVDPVEVEDVLAMHPKVREAVVVGIPGKTPGEEIVKAVVVADGTVDKKELIKMCQDRLALYKVPRFVEFRDEIPKSPLGKVLRKYLV
jgi:long-chain acyl-CoA synthetase